ncbi:MAG: hypothetical protein NT062_05545 [Proteobacteria bacterium]|nr:hypothetical protein [Pseudomonadota bacterium]
MRALALVALGVSACRPQDPPAIDGPPIVPVDTAPDADPKVANCATLFGTGLTNAFGRLDGTISAVIPPNYQDCAMPNRTHLVLQVDVDGAIYRMVVNVASDQGPPDVFFDQIAAPLAGAPWASGWHPGEQLDYVAQLGLHADAFVATPTAQLVPTISDQLVLGAHVSVYATSENNNSSSAHLVHRNGGNQDGAIVIDPETAPRYLVMHFDEQLF